MSYKGSLASPSANKDKPQDNTKAAPAADKPTSLLDKKWDEVAPAKKA
jgi:hypothetical protein